MKPKTLILGKMPQNAQPENTLAAGPWCFYDNESQFPHWEKRFTFAPEPLADRSLLPSASRAAQALAIQLVPQVALELAPAPDAAATLPITYWQILLLPWLIDLASQIIDRALRCKAMTDCWGELPLQVPVLPPHTNFMFRTEHDFTLRGSMGVQFNYWLFSRLLEMDWPKTWTKLTEQENTCNETFPKDASRSDGLRNILHKMALKLNFPKIKGADIAQTLRLSLALEHKCLEPEKSLDLNAAFSFHNDLNAIIPPHWDLKPIWQISIPQSLKNLRHKPVRPKQTSRLRIASIKAQENTAYRQQLAYWRAAGNRIAHIQHGGNYGVVKTPCAAELVEYSQQAFFTWGWNTQGNAKGNFEPMPSFQLCRQADAWHGSPENPLIFVGTEMAVYGHRLDSHPTPLQYVRYREAKCIFFETLAREIRKISMYRPYFPLPGTLADETWLLPRFPDIHLCSGPLHPQLLKCGLLVLDHHGTTLLEAMAANIPFIAYWNPRAWPVTPEFEALLQMMATAGIWHDNPRTAAAKVNEIWADTATWWQNSKIQKTRQIFCKQQIMLVKNPEKTWKKKLKAL